MMAPNPAGLMVVGTAASEATASGRLAVVADRKQPVLDGEPNAFLDKGLRDAGNAGAVGALPHQFFEIGNGGERQRNRNTVGFGFFCGHAKKLAVKRCTEKYLFRVYLDSEPIGGRSAPSPGYRNLLEKQPEGGWRRPSWPRNSPLTLDRIWIAWRR